MIFRKAGYYVTVESWENDGDYSATESVFCATKEAAQAAVDFCNMFTSCNHEKNSGIGNLTEGEMPVAVAATKKFFEAHPEMLGDLTIEDFDSEEESMQDDLGYMIMDLASEYGLNGKDELQVTRVAEKITVEYFPLDVTCEDVTKEFKAKKRK